MTTTLFGIAAVGHIYMLVAVGLAFMVLAT